MNFYYYPKKLLVFGIATIICGFYFFSSTLFTLNSSLTHLVGKLDTVQVLYEQVQASRGYGSTKSKLVFKLKNESQVFILMKNIGHEWNNKQFERIALEMNNSKRLSIAIKKDQLSEMNPTVFQIINNRNKILYNIKDAKSHSKIGFLICMSIGLLAIGVFLKIRPHN